MLPSLRKSKTRMGSALSMQSEMAVASITVRPRFRTSRYSRVSNLTAAGFRLGSESYTPSTFVPLRMASASISSARWAAVVSVEKYGAPRPAAKITTRPFSR